MNDKESLRLLTEVIENAKETTAKYPYAAYKIYYSFIYNFRDISSHIQNINLRKCFLLLYTLEDPLRESYNTILREKVNMQLASLLKQTELDEGLKELIYYATDPLTVRVISDGEGRSTIDTKRLLSEISPNLEGVDETLKTKILSLIANGIRKLYPDFTKEISKDMLNFYDKIIAATKKDWSSVFNAVTDHCIEKDKKAILWK